MLSVVIATRNRADALKNISLPSLLRQDCFDFEIIVWDASDNEDSKKICESIATNFRNVEINLRYFRAPRVGLTSQRNDAVKEAKGDFIFFIDDDSEVSPDGIGILINAFRDNPDRMGLALPLIDGGGKKRPSLLKRFRKKDDRKIGEYRPPKLCGTYLQGRDAEWLSGCDMAFKREVFDVLSFEERLQKFGGYAFAEDVDFSHRVALNWKKYLLITQTGFVQHLAVEGGRTPDRDKRVAAVLFNRFIMRQNFGVPNFKNKMRFYWEGALRYKLSRGFWMARKAVEEELAKCASRSS